MLEGFTDRLIQRYVRRIKNKTNKYKGVRSTPVRNPKVREDIDRKYQMWLSKQCSPKTNCS